MTDKELRRLRRDDLLQILINQQRQIDDLTALVEDYEKQLNERKIAIEEAGSLAEAVLKLNGVFDAAQKAADQYLEETKRRVGSLREETDGAIERAQKQAEDILREARSESQRILAGAKREAADIRARAGEVPTHETLISEPEETETEHKGLFGRKKA